MSFLLLKEKWGDKGAEVGDQARDGVGYLEVETVKEYDDDEYKEMSDDEIVLRNREQWEQTDHFNVHYSKPMAQDAKELAAQLKPEDDKFGEAWIMYWQDLKNEFWDGYDEEACTYEVVREERKEREKKGKGKKK